MHEVEHLDDIDGEQVFFPLLLLLFFVGEREHPSHAPMGRKHEDLPRSQSERDFLLGGSVDGACREHDLFVGRQLQLPLSTRRRRSHECRASQRL